MRRRLNLRLLLWTLGCVAGLGVSVSFLHAYQVRRNAHFLLERGTQALEKKDNDQALFFLGQYLALAPHDLDALEKFALTIEKSAQNHGARVRVILRIEDLLLRDPDRHEARRRLIHNLINLSRHKDAIVHLQFLAAHGQSDAELHHLLGFCQAVAGNTSAAVAALHEALAQDPAHIASYRLLAEILHERQSQEHDAAEIMNKMVAANPKNHEAYLVRSHFEQQRGRVAEAIKDVQQAAVLAPNDAGVLLAVARWAASQSRLDEARRYLSRGVELHPTNDGLVKALADLELRAGRRDEAIRVLREGITRAPEAFELHVRLADLLVDSGHYAEVEKHIATLVRAGLPPAFPDYLQARLAVAHEKWHEAITLLEKVRVELGTHTEWSSRVHALLGACYEHVGDTERRVASFQRAVQIEPGWLAAKHNLGLALLAAGRLEDAVTELTVVSNAKDPSPAVWASFAPPNLQLSMRLPDPLRDWSVVERALAKAEAADPARTEVILLRAELLMARRDYAKAETLLDQARGGAKNLAFWTARAELAARQGHYEDGLRILEDATKLFGDALELRLSRALLLGQRGNDEDRQALHGVSQKLEIYPPEAQIRLLRTLAQTWQTLGDADAAESLWRKVAKAQPDDVRSRFVLMDLALQQGDQARTQELLAELRKLEGDLGVFWRWGAIALQVQEARGAVDRLALARAQLAELGRRRPDWPRIPQLEARIDELEGKSDLALENLVRAIELGERQPRFVRGVAQRLLERRMTEKAERVLMLVESQAPLSPELARLAAEAAAGTKNAPRLRQLVADLFPAPPRDYRDLVWLARLHANVSEPAQTETYLRQAVLLGSHAPDAWIALVEHLARTGQHDAAQAAIASMEKTMPAKRVSYARARCWDVAGDAAKAQAAYAQALAEQPNDFMLLAAAADFHRRADRPALAAPFYERLLEPSGAAPGDVQAMARRQLALGHARAGHGSIALAALDVNRQALGDQPADQRIRWFIDGQHATKRKQAITLLKESFRRHPSDADEEMLLIDLLDADDDAPQAREHLAQVLLARETPQWIARHVRLLVKTEAFSDASLWLAKLQRWEPNHARSQELKQLVLKAGGA